MTLSIRFLFIGLLVASQNKFANANRDDGVARFMLHKGHATQQHGDLFITSEILEADNCDQRSIFIEIAGEDKKIQESEWTDLFTEMDANEGNSISKSEMVEYFRNKEMDCDEDALNFFFDKFDVDKNGAIDQDEWKKAWQTLLEADKAGNIDGELDEDEWTAAFQASETQKGETCDLGSIFKVITGKDNQLEESEWIVLFTEMESDKGRGISKEDMAKYLKNNHLDCNDDALNFFFDKFDAAKDGAINQQEWKKAWQTLLVADNYGSKDGTLHADEWTATFQASDTQKGETCDSNSIFKVIGGKDHKIEETEWRVLFTEMDADKGNSISKADMAEYFKKKQLDCNEDALKFFFDKFDVDKNGTIDQDEWNKAWQTLLAADKAGNNDGKRRIRGRIEEVEWNDAFGDAESKESKSGESGAPRFSVSFSALWVVFACFCF